MSKLRSQVRCSQCGALRPVNELNGTNPLTGDVSQAYCRQLLQCQSREAQTLTDWVLDSLNEDQEKVA